MNSIYKVAHYSQYLLLVCGLVFLTACGIEQLPFKGTDVSNVQGLGGNFTLVDQNGKTRQLSDFKGKVVALFFGYTHCPDICPTTLLEYKYVMKQLKAQAQNVQVLFISVDPERDTPSLLANYVPHFSPHFLGLTGDLKAIEAVKQQYKVVSEKVKTPNSMGYTVDHSAGSYLIDTKGRVRVFEPYGTAVEDLVNDILLLLGKHAVVAKLE